MILISLQNNYLVSPPTLQVYTTIMELGTKNHNGDGLLGPNSINVVYNIYIYIYVYIYIYMDPLG